MPFSDINFMILSKVHKKYSPLIYKFHNNPYFAKLVLTFREIRIIIISVIQIINKNYERNVINMLSQFLFEHTPLFDTQREAYGLYLAVIGFQLLLQ